MDVKTAGRVLEIFELFSSEQRSLSLTEIAKALDVPMSSCHNLLRALESRGYLYFVGERKQTYPSRKMFELSNRISQAEPWRDQIEPLLRTLRQQTGETVIFGRRQGDKAVYLMVLESLQRIRFTALPGDLRPLHASGLGKALLMASAGAEREKDVSRLKLTSCTPRTITTAKQLLADLAKSDERGYALSKGEYAPDAVTIARPVKLWGSLYAVAVTGPSSRMSEKLDQHARHLGEIEDGDLSLGKPER